MSSSATITPRCPECGYRRVGSLRARCSECGSATNPIQRLERAAVQRGVAQFSFTAFCVWLLLVMPTLLAHLAINTDAIGLYVLSGMLAIVSLLLVPVFALVLTAIWLRWFMHALWSVADGEAGPWSRTSVYARVFALLVLIQLLGASIVGIASYSNFPGYPAGWP